MGASSAGRQRRVAVLDDWERGRRPPDSHQRGSRKVPLSNVLSGCHTPDGSGVRSAATEGNDGVFLRSQRGREFMVQVPISNIQAGDAQLAEVLNWCIENFSASSLINGDYLPYTAEEVGRLRQSPLQEIDNTRAEVLAEIARLPE